MFFFYHVIRIKTAII